MKSIIILLATLFATSALSAQTNKRNKLVPKGARPSLVSSGFEFTEGPAVDANGDIFFTDQPNNRILKWTHREGVSVFMENAGRANGLYFDRDGNLLACADEKNELWQISPDKKVTVLVTDYQGRKLNGPNDLWVAPDGGIYFTDPFYKRPYWSRTQKEITEENVYYLSPDKKTLSMAMDGFVRPNGIVGTGDGTKVYVSDINAGKTYVFSISSNGTLGKKEVFCEMGSDGMTIDNRGNIYLTGKGVTIFDPSGKQIGHIPIDEPWTANVCFGGKKRKTLFITASKSVYTIEMRVKGARR